MTPSGSASSQSALPAHRKGVLFCPDCAHASPCDGDWEVTETSEFATYHCPACGTCIQTRPAFEAEPVEPTARRQAMPPVGGTPRAVENWTRVWSSWVIAWVRFVRRSEG